MNEVAWFSRAPVDPNAAKSLRHALLESDLDAVAEIALRIAAGEQLGPEYFPRRMFYTPDKGRSAALPDIFKGGGYWVVSSTCASILRQFDLGHSQLFPVEICLHDSLEPAGVEYFCLSLGNTRSALLPDMSSSLRQVSAGKWQVKATASDDDLALDRNAIAGADFWIDPAVHMTFFLSDRLMSALREGKADKGFGNHIPVRRCRVVTT